MKKILLSMLLASLVISSATGVVIILIGDVNEMQTRLLLTMLASISFSLAGLACARRPSNVWLSPVPILGMVASTLTLAVIVLRIWDRQEVLPFWDPLEVGDGGRKLSVTLIVLVVSLAHLSILAALRPVNDLMAYCRRGAMLAVSALGVLLITVVLQDLDLKTEGFYVRLVSAVVILDVVGTASMGLLARWGTVPEPGQPKASRTRKAPRRA